MLSCRSVISYRHSSAGATAFLGGLSGVRSSSGRVVVVGAGIVGLSTAWHLQQAGATVTVLDREGVAAGSSWGNAGWLAPALTLPLPEPAILRTGILATLKPNSPVYVPLRADRPNRLVEVGVGHHDHVILGAAEALDALGVGGTAGINVLGDGARADEADGPDVRVV